MARVSPLASPYHIHRRTVFQGWKSEACYSIIEPDSTCLIIGITAVRFYPDLPGGCSLQTAALYFHDTQNDALEAHAQEA
jgi:hypothetical protein